MKAPHKAVNISARPRLIQLSR